LGKEKLFSEFPPISAQQWEELVRQDLKGADYEKKLIWKTNEGIKVKPYYRAEDIEKIVYKDIFPGKFPFVRGNKSENNNWEIRQDIKVGDLVQSNKAALDALKNGATGIGFILDNNSLNKTDLEKLINNISIECISFNLISNSNANILFDLIKDHCKNEKLDQSVMNGSICLDPLGELSITGNWKTDEKSDFLEIKSFIEEAGSNIPLYRVLGVNGKIFQDSGASIVQELGFALAAGVEYVNKLTDLGLTVDTIVPRMQFDFSVSSNYFIEIAKIRAFRLLWATIIKAYSPKNEDTARIYVHSTTGRWNMTLYDPYVNVLRATTESMSAIIGGTDSLSVTPFDRAYRTADDFSNRLARNIQIILSEEAYFNRVVDPAAGSYYIENLTNSIAEVTWSLFQKVENEGGYISSLQKGIVQSEIEIISNKRINDIASRRETILGTNQYPNFNELMLDCIESGVFKNQQEPLKKQILKPIKCIRGALAFEELRLTTEKSGKRPRVFMLTIGNLAMRLARSQFSSNFFAIAGFKVIDNNGFDTVVEGVEAAKTVKADIIVLCSSDDEYAAFAPEAFKEVGDKAILVVAGAPACQAELEKVGIKNFINMKSNVLVTLKSFQQELNID
jgi:methylmalonyl-CoA mutase